LDDKHGEKLVKGVDENFFVDEKEKGAPSFNRHSSFKQEKS
jgi:hypothetical protein